MNNRLIPLDIVRAGMCIGCGSCVAQADAPDTHMQFDAYGHLKPHGPPAWLRRRSARLTHTCPFSPAARNEGQLAAELFPTAAQRDASVGRFHTAYVGYVAAEDFRRQGSSGGMVSWVAAELLRTGAVDAVAHVAPGEDPAAPRFAYRVSRSEAELRSGARSRYYPVELSGVLAAIRATPGRYAIVALPCFTKALHLLRASDPVLS